MNDDDLSRDERLELTEEYRGLGSDIAVAVAAAIAGGATTPIVENLLDRPPKEEAPGVIVPPGVSKD